MNALPGELNACVCFGAVMHERERPVLNRFVYKLAFLRLPLSRLNSLRVPLLGIDRPNVFSVRSRDHGPRTGEPLLPWIRGLLGREGLGEAADGEVVLQTLPRIFGFVFNPVSFWFCHDTLGRLRVVLAEVNNTFGDSHRYLLHHPDHRPIERGDELVASKVFHVSPFFDLQGEYRFSFSCQRGTYSARIDYFHDDLCRLATRIGGKAAPLDGRSMRRWLFRFPFMTLGVIARIHWQALRLWWSRVPFHARPAPPREDVTR